MDEPFLKRTRTTSPDQRDSITKDTNSLTINLDVLDEVKDSFPRPGSGLSKTRILILMSDTGGGHRASAQSLEAAFKELYGDRQEVLTVDIFCEWMRAPFNLFPEWYRYLQSNPCLWRALWFYGTCNCSRQLSEAHTYYQEAKRIQTRLLEINPDIIISVHPMVNDVMVRILQDLPEITAPYVTVVTDFGGAHRMVGSKQSFVGFIVSSGSAKELIQSMFLLIPSIRLGRNVESRMKNSSTSVFLYASSFGSKKMRKGLMWLTRSN